MVDGNNERKKEGKERKKGNKKGPGDMMRQKVAGFSAETPNGAQSLGRIEKRGVIEVIFY